MGKTIFLLLTCFTTCYCQNVPIINMNILRLREDLRQGEFAFQIDAYDIDGDDLTYSVKDSNYYFAVNKFTGVAVINNTMDRETKPTFSIEVIVNDGVYADTSKIIPVILLDANDNKPTFENLPYSVEVREDTPVESTLLTVLAIDPDEGMAGLISYSIYQVIPAEGSNMFTISPRGGEIVLKEPLKKSGFYQIKIDASDGGGPLHENPNFVQFETTTAIIRVIDVPHLDP